MDNQEKDKDRQFIHCPPASCHLLLSCVASPADPVPSLTVTLVIDLGVLIKIKYAVMLVMCLWTELMVVQSMNLPI